MGQELIINPDHGEPLNARMPLETLSLKKFVEFYIKMILSHLMSSFWTLGIMYLSGLVMKVAILNKKLFKIWRKNTWHRRHQREKVHQLLPFIKVKNQSHSLDFSLDGTMNFGILMYQTNCNTHKMLNAMQKVQIDLLMLKLFK